VKHIETGGMKLLSSFAMICNLHLPDIILNAVHKLSLALFKMVLINTKQYIWNFMWNGRPHRFMWFKYEKEL